MLDPCWLRDCLIAELGARRIFHLRPFDERPWNDLRGKPVDNRWLARQLKKYGVASKDVKLDGTNKKGFAAEDLFDPWTRYVAE